MVNIISPNDFKFLQHQEKSEENLFVKFTKLYKLLTGKIFSVINVFLLYPNRENFQKTHLKRDLAEVKKIYNIVILLNIENIEIL